MLLHVFRSKAACQYLHTHIHVFFKNRHDRYSFSLVCTNHTYASQDMFDPDDKISGGQGFIYASSIVVAMKKLKLKEDEVGLFFLFCEKTPL